MKSSLAINCIWPNLTRVAYQKTKSTCLSLIYHGRLVRQQSSFQLFVSESRLYSCSSFIPRRNLVQKHSSSVISSGCISIKSQRSLHMDSANPTDTTSSPSSAVPTSKRNDNSSKRKQPSKITSERPSKQIRSTPAGSSALPPSQDLNHHHNPNHTHDPDIDMEMSSAEALPLDDLDGGIDGTEPHPEQVIRRTPTANAETAEWQAAIQKVVKSVVAIHFAQPCAFDMDPAFNSEATGFVVDAENGYILTNRHVVGAGPFWGYCIFDNHEECDVKAVYRDPVHDFGILKFEPKDIKYMPVSALNLRPDLARVGAEIRVVGNDAGEKLSILSGVISRLDRNAPDYGEGYCDFNTNYIQAAASASGGSSGSPVVNIDGHVIALQAGGRSDGAATDYFLPLDRPLRALKLIQENNKVSRGTIQTQWFLRPFDECRRLGLTADTEALVRSSFPTENNMLTAEVVLPDGPADKKIMEGDILIRVNGELLTQLIRLDDILDSSVGKTIDLLIQRGGKDIQVQIDVGDLHDITPDRFVNVCGASFHDLSYQQARSFAVSLKNQGAFVTEMGGSFRFEGFDSLWLVQEVDDIPTPNLDTFIEVMSQLPDRKRIVVAYRNLRDMHTRHTQMITIDRHWTPKMRLVTRNDSTGLWDFKNLAEPIKSEPKKPERAEFVKISGSKYPKALRIIRSFVKITSMCPVKIDGFPRTKKTAYGLVIDAELGLVVVSRAVVPFDLCDVTVTIADSVVVDGKVVFLHPMQNYTIIKYDPKLVNAPVESAKLSSKYLKQGDDTIFFGFNHNFKPVTAKTVVTDITTVGIPASAAFPRYRATNIDAITVDTTLSSGCSSGVLISEEGEVQALWMSYLGERSSSGKDLEYHLGYAVPMMLPIIEQVRKGIAPEVRIMSVEMQTIMMSQARMMGVGDSWIERVEKENPERHQLFMVRKIDSGYNGNLEESDIILTLDGKLVTEVQDLNVQYDRKSLEVSVIRKKQTIKVQVPCVPTADLETQRAVIFCGALLQPPHHAVRQQISKIHSSIYISGRMRGSPAACFGLAPTTFITHVNGVSTLTLDAFLSQTHTIPDNTYFRIRAISFDNVPFVVTLKKNEHYFPTVDFCKSRDVEAHTNTAGWTWEMHDIDSTGIDGVSGESNLEAPPDADGVEVAPLRLLR